MFGLALGSGFLPGFTGATHPAMPDLLTESTHAAKAYYAQGPALGITPTNFHDRASTLAPAWQAHVRAQGFAAAKAELEFLRYCLEW